MKDMELYDSFIRETTDLLGAPTQKWAYKERDGRTAARASSCCCATLPMSSAAARTTP